MFIPAIASRPSVSQSLVKELRNDVCPRRIYGAYVLGLPTVPTDSQLRGIYFEYKLTGSCGKSGIPPIEPLQKTGKRYVDFERLDGQAQFIREELFPYYGIEILDTDVVIATEFTHPDTDEIVTVKCRLDVLARVNNKLAVIDIKATGDVANGGWRNPIGLDHTQAYFYMWALYQSKELNSEGVMPEFYYIVADWSPRSDYEVIKVEWNNGSFWEVRHAATEAFDKMKSMEEQGFPARPSYQQCQSCPFQHSCTDKKQFKEVKVIW
ncbi:PD-(D/E)XK nuclease family protein [Xanthocytophaga agilis]|uniref:PD-(D/E)XK nuclease family protein n=1 Tax=Xanthocytophaga agilis TaxID=3048010 RepID=A0AAE3QWP4_9BACT|nr:PD-(D/E)XK nuclease family protein [Xanthocytophaga agilis]MDJ1499371.1 PD-(D/E)XK nuclease family protein [Xanthocytophaga agilis]